MDERRDNMDQLAVKNMKENHGVSQEIQDSRLLVRFHIEM